MRSTSILVLAVFLTLGVAVGAMAMGGGMMGGGMMGGWGQGSGWNGQVIRPDYHRGYGSYPNSPNTMGRYYQGEQPNGYNQSAERGYGQRYRANPGPGYVPSPPYPNGTTGNPGR